MLLLLGVCALGYCAIVLGAEQYYQLRAFRQLQELNRELPDPSVASHPTTYATEAAPMLKSSPALVGRVSIPHVHLSAMIAEGSTSRLLRIAVGHVPGTALPGQSGNVVLVAHRDTFFRNLGSIEPGDVIRISVPGDEYTYDVTFTDIVTPRETWVMEPRTGEILTLITCYPFHFIGAAPERFVVRARREIAADEALGRAENATAD